MFRLNYAAAASVVQVLRPLIAPNNIITAYPANNTIVVTDFAENVRRIARIIATIDTPAGMTEPASDTGRTADADDIASTDMSAEPSSRTESTQPLFGGGVETKLETELAELQDRHLRLAAEFDNYRKRINRERVELSDRAQASFVARLLDVLDDMDRLVASDPGTPLPAPPRKGG